MVIYKLHTTQHNENECAVACIETILKKYKYYVNYTELKDILHIKKDGINVNDIANFFKKLNVKTSVFKVNIDYFNKKSISFKKTQFPCMALLTVEEGYHYIVIHKISNGKYVYSDPAKNIFTIATSSRFLKDAKYILCFDFSKFDINSNELPLKKNNNRYLIDELIHEKKNIFKVSCINILISIISVMTSMKFGVFIDSIKNNNNDNYAFYLMFTFSMFLFLIVIENIIKYISNSLSIKITKKIENNIRNKVTGELMRQNYYELTNSNTGDIISRLENYIDLTISFVKCIFNSISDIMLVFFTIIWMLYTDIWLTCIIIFSLLLNIVIVKLSIYKLYFVNYEAMETYSHYNGNLVEVVNFFETIKTTCSELFHLNNLKKGFSKYINKTKDAELFFNELTTYRQFISAFTDLLITVFGVLIVVNGKISTGELATYFIMSNLLHSVSNRVIDFFIQLESYYVSYERLTQVIETNTRNTNRTISTDLNSVKCIEFLNYSIYYDDYIIMNSNFKFESRNIILRGESGSGKSSLVKTLAKLRNNYDGQILVNDIDIKNIDDGLLKSKIVYVSNDCPIFTGTILNNLCLGKTVLRERLEKICSDFEILKTIKENSDEFNHMLYANNVKLSTGQKQRIALVRAMLFEPEILILDEALSNLDQINKLKIIEKLQKYNCMKIFITHEDLKIANSQTFYIKNNMIQKID